ncbi:hypothetical protein N5W20_07415 [Candidatus Kirkpatrickella diaphorinae]|uniref:Glycosyltransferase 2-like domain-containing protein n=1 Tax=Candidatus Kirkpatrickella diaphorinae TaxID=2984322 RepID=A0ABY6GHC6_9PROT|nr:glycosyltransferase [Candidatus Kirkpatrickella diaphorinae]UYH50929.1 hypothetical protein N5W20_07415 [Candidatus Kirkpatrickella diaphorinae]
MKQTVAAVRRHTQAEHHLVVVDDGSIDETAATLRALDCDFILGGHRGIAWNKNRALYYLKVMQSCHVIILLEDDTFPTADGWETSWIEAGRKLGHANIYLPDVSGEKIICGAGTGADPFVATNVSGQCAVFHQQALDHVGYMDSRFTGYGYEHVEHTHRMIETGFGGLIKDEGEARLHCSFLIQSPLEVTEQRTELPEEEIARSGRIWAQIRHDPLFRVAWRNDAERAVFLAEMYAARDYQRAETAIPFWHRWVIGTDQEFLLRYDEAALMIETSEEPPENPVIAFCDGRRLHFMLKSAEGLVFLVPSLEGDLNFTPQSTPTPGVELTIGRGHRRAVTIWREGLPLTYQEGDGARLVMATGQEDHGAFIFLRYDHIAPKATS